LEIRMTKGRASEEPDRGLAPPGPSREAEAEAAIRPSRDADGEPDVGLAQKGLGEDAVVRRETEI
jgi:hypothetical protein